MAKKSKASLTQWAHFRFSVIGGLLARPPKKGQLVSYPQISCFFWQKIKL